MLGGGTQVTRSVMEGDRMEMQAVYEAHTAKPEPLLLRGHKWGPS